jgi:hypothetical protein
MIPEAPIGPLIESRKTSIRESIRGSLSQIGEFQLAQRFVQHDGAGI